MFNGSEVRYFFLLSLSMSLLKVLSLLIAPLHIIADRVLISRRLIIQNKSSGQWITQHAAACDWAVHQTSSALFVGSLGDSIHW